MVPKAALEKIFTVALCHGAAVCRHLTILACSENEFFSLDNQHAWPTCDLYKAHVDRMGKEQTILKHAILLPHEIVGALYDFGSGFFERFLIGTDEVSGNLIRI